VLRFGRLQKIKRESFDMSIL